MGRIKFHEKCKCGIDVSGFSLTHLKKNIKIHNEGKRHKERMKLIKDVQDQEKKE